MAKDPVKCNGKTIIIDGGFSRAYQPTTGIAGFTLISDSEGLSLATHEPFVPVQEAIQNNDGVRSSVRAVAPSEKPLLVADTDEGLKLEQRIANLKQLLIQ